MRHQNKNATAGALIAGMDCINLYSRVQEHGVAAGLSAPASVVAGTQPVRRIDGGRPYKVNRRQQPRHSFPEEGKRTIFIGTGSAPLKKNQASILGGNRTLPHHNTTRHATPRAQTRHKIPSTSCAFPSVPACASHAATSSDAPAPTTAPALRTPPPTTNGGFSTKPIHVAFI